MQTMSRRKLLRNGAQAVLAGGAALSAIPRLEAQGSAKSTPKAVDYYQKLGVTPLINAAGTYTVLSASTIPDEVRAAIELAARSPVISTNSSKRQVRIWPSNFVVKPRSSLPALPLRSWGNGGMHHHGKRAAHSGHSNGYVPS